MAKFIEVTDTGNNKHFINVNHIEEIIGYYIYFAFNVPTEEEQDYIVCKESYDEIVAKIKKAEK